MGKRLSLFPMNRDLCAVARYADLLYEYKLTHLFVPRYLRMGGNDVCRLDGGTHTYMSLTDYSKDKLRECDVLYMDFDEAVVSIDFCKEIISHAKEMNVEIMPSRMLRKKLHDEFDTLPATEEVPFAESPEDDILHEINIPVVMVLSHGLLTDQLAVEFALRRHFTEAGYKVAQIGSHDVCELFGYTDMPDFMLKPADAYEKIVRFNRYTSNMALDEMYEIMIIGVPGAIVKYSDRKLQGLGVLPFIICNAVRSDVTVACTHYAEYEKIFFDEVARYGKYRLGSPIHFFNMANTSVAPDQSIVQDTTLLTYTNLESSFVLNTLKGIKADGYHLFNALDKDSVKEACVAVQSILSGNAPFIR